MEDDVAPFAFSRSARNLKTAIIVFVFWALVITMWLYLEAALWIVFGFAAFSLPALIDLWRNPQSGLVLASGQMRWWSGTRTVVLDRTEIEYVHLNTRLDFSTSVTVALHTGRKIKVPFEATPPDKVFETALTTHQIRTRRTHFQLLQ
ncbi:MAG: hypothetical protein AAF755_12480 [Pseudomonadota bacterium]